MPPPEKTEHQPSPEGQADTVADSESTLGLRLEALVKSPTWEVGLPAVIHDFAQGEVILLLADPVSARTTVEVQVNTCSFQGDILYCQPKGSLWEAHISFDDVDASGLRRSPRFPVRIPARVFGGASDIPVGATIVDISGDGLGIEMAEAVAVQTRVAVQSQESTALGQVRHCREFEPGRFRAGVQLHHIIRKDRELAQASAESGGWVGKLARRLKIGG